MPLKEKAYRQKKYCHRVDTSMVLRHTTRHRRLRHCFTPFNSCHNYRRRGNISCSRNTQRDIKRAGNKKRQSKYFLYFQQAWRCGKQYFRSADRSLKRSRIVFHRRHTFHLHARQQKQVKRPSCKDGNSVSSWKVKKNLRYCAAYLQYVYSLSHGTVYRGDHCRTHILHDFKRLCIPLRRIN